MTILALASLALAACSAGSRTAVPQRGPAGGGAFSGRATEGGVTPEPIPVQAVTVEAGTLTTTNETSGTVQPATESKVAARTQGTVLKILREPGDWVKPGQPVIQLDATQLVLAVKTAESNLSAARIDLSTNEDTTSQANPKLEAQVRAARASLSAAQKNYDSQKALLEIGGATSTQVDVAQSDLQAAQANLQAAETALDQNRKAPAQTLAQLRIAVEKAEHALQEAQVNLQYATITAPFAGQISDIPVNPGEYVQPSTTAFVLVSAEREIHFNVPPAHASRFPIGAKLAFTYEGESHPVTVKRRPSAPISGMVPMVASVPAAYSPSFGCVGTVSYSIPLAKGTLVPLAALKTTEDRNYVFVIRDGAAATAEITLVAESGITAAVNGMAPGSRVIVNPPPGLLDGTPVRPVEAQEK